MIVRFVFVCDGSSDVPFVDHLETLCIRHGATEAVGEAPDLRRLPQAVGKRVEDQVEAALRLVPEANLVFVHRDADAADSSDRHDEIRNSMSATSYEGQWVPVVPVQETEAWLILNEGEIRFVAGKPRGSVQLDIPTPAQVESISRPKEVLQELLLRASEKSGRHLERVKKQFPHHRRLLIERLNIDGVLSQVPAWNSLDIEIREVLEGMQA